MLLLERTPLTGSLQAVKQKGTKKTIPHDAFPMLWGELRASRVFPCNCWCSRQEQIFLWTTFATKIFICQ